MTEQKTVRELSNVKTVKDMKDVLYSKLKEEGCGFKKSDIKFTATTEGFTLQVEDFYHSSFYIHFDYDDYFGYEVWVSCGSPDYPDEKEIIDYETSHTMLDLYTALIHIGYYVATRF